MQLENNVPYGVDDSFWPTAMIKVQDYLFNPMLKKSHCCALSLQLKVSISEITQNNEHY